MREAFELAFWLSLGILAVLIPTYTFAASQLARSRRTAATLAPLLRSKLSREIQSEQQRLEQAAGSTTDLERTIRRHKRDSKRLKQLEIGFRLGKCLVVPAALLLMAATLSSVGHALLPNPYMLLPAWCLLAVAAWFIYKALALAQAVIQLSVPELELRLVSTDLTWQARAAHELVFVATLVSGEALYSTSIALFLPTEFRSVGPQGLQPLRPTFEVPEDVAGALLPGHSAILSKTWDYKPLMPFRYSFHHLTVPSAGSYSIHFAAYGEGFATGLQSAAINVV